MKEEKYVQEELEDELEANDLTSTGRRLPAFTALKKKHVVIIVMGLCALILFSTIYGFTRNKKSTDVNSNLVPAKAGAIEGDQLKNIPTRYSDVDKFDSDKKKETKEAVKVLENVEPKQQKHPTPQMPKQPSGSKGMTAAEREALARYQLREKALTSPISFDIKPVK